MAELTPLDEKLGEVLGLAQAAQEATDGARSWPRSDDDIAQQLEPHARGGARRPSGARDELVDGSRARRRRSTSKARETKAEATEMMKTYLGGDAEELDGFEFLTMAEAGELGHWEIVREMSAQGRRRRGIELAEWALPIQQRHTEIVRECSLELAAEEAVEA